MTVEVNAETRDQLLDIRARAMIRQPIRTVERAKSHLAASLMQESRRIYTHKGSYVAVNPAATADAIGVLDRAWKQLYAASRNRRVG